MDSSYGGVRMSSTAQEVRAVKQWRFPPVSGYKTEVVHGAERTLSTANLANLTIKGTPSILYNSTLKVEIW